MPESDEPNPWRMAHIGLELAGAVVVLTLAGYWVDRQLGSAPWGVVVGVCLGFTGGMYLFIKQATTATGRYSSKKQDRQDRDDT